MDENQVLMLINQVIGILNQHNISDGQIMERTGNKYSKPTISNFRHLKSTNPNLETFVDICTAAGIRIRLDTEQSEQAEINQSIEEYRVKYAEIVAENERLREQRSELQAQISVLSKSAEDLTRSVSTLTKTNSVLSDSLLRSNERFDKLAEKANLL